MISTVNVNISYSFHSYVESAGRFVERRAVAPAGCIPVIPDDQVRVVDTSCKRTIDPSRYVQERPDAILIEEAVRYTDSRKGAIRSSPISNHMGLIVDASRECAGRAWSAQLIAVPWLKIKDWVTLFASVKDPTTCPRLLMPNGWTESELRKPTTCPALLTPSMVMISPG